MKLKKIVSIVLSGVIATSFMIGSAISASAAGTAKTTAVTAVTAAASKAKVTVPTVAKIDSRTIMRYEYGMKNFKNFVLYDFSDKKESGIGRDGTSNPARMCYGLTARIKNNKIYFKAYNDYPDEFNLKLKALDLISDSKATSLKLSNKTQSIDLSKYNNGVYAIRATFSSNKKPVIIAYVNDGKTYLCSAEKMTKTEYNKFKSRRETIWKLMDKENITPENSIATDILCYPWNDEIGMNNDTPKWIKLSNKITKPEWSDSRKLFAIHEWMSENLAYDYYKSNVLKKPRAAYYKVYDGTYDTYQTHIGVCADFTNILATMCRAQGIPCITLETKAHGWNAVYINGNWIEIDMTVDIDNSVYGEDMTDWVRPSQIHTYHGFYDEFVNNVTPVEINDSLWTYDILNGRQDSIAVG